MEPINDPSYRAVQPVAAAPAAAGPMLRAGSFAIDALIVGTTAYCWTVVIWRIAPLSAPLMAIGGTVFLVVGYYGWMTARNYHTLGQGFAGLTLARVDYQPLTPRRAYWRVFLFGLSSGMVLPNLIIMLFDRRRRTIHDLLTKTWVYALPNFDRRRRFVTLVAALLLIIFGTLRATLAISDKLEEHCRLSLRDIGNGVDFSQHQGF